MSLYDVASIFVLTFMIVTCLAAAFLAYHLITIAQKQLAYVSLASLAFSVLLTVSYSVVTWCLPVPAPAASAASAPPAYAAERSSSWRSVRADYLLLHPVCEACGASESLHVHHIVSFSDAPELELEYRNLITLCREHHFSIGHDPDGPWGPKTPNWKLNNPYVWQDASRARNETQD